MATTSFSANFNNSLTQVPSGVWTKLTPSTTAWNDSAYYSAGRFAPTGGSPIRARLSASIAWALPYFSLPDQPVELWVYINGIPAQRIGTSTAKSGGASGACIVALNGTTDYAEIWIHSLSQGGLLLLVDPISSNLTGEIVN